MRLISVVFCALMLAPVAAQAADDTAKLLDMLATEGTPESLTASREELDHIRKMLGQPRRMERSASTDRILSRQEDNVFPSPRSHRQLVYR